MEAQSCNLSGPTPTRLRLVVDVIHKDIEKTSQPIKLFKFLQLTSVRRKACIQELLILRYTF